MSEHCKKIHLLKSLETVGTIKFNISQEKCNKNGNKILKRKIKMTKIYEKEIISRQTM